MDVDLAVRVPASADPRTLARTAEDAGFGAVWFAEVTHDPVVASAVAATATSRIGVGTSVAVALVRSPMTTAMQAMDVQKLSGGRFRLGLGSQVRAHVVRRYGASWDRPVTRLREHVEAVRAVWAAWSDGSPLDFRGEVHELTLMPPAFVPEPSPHPPPPILLAGVGPQMTAMSGAVADGFIAHSFASAAHLSTVTLPTLRKAGGDRPGFEVVGSAMVATGATPVALAAATEAARSQVAFYGSTPAYRAILETHDRGALADELHALTRAGRWRDLPALVDDELLHELVVVAEPADVVPRVRARYAGLVDRVSLLLPAAADPALVSMVGDG